MGLLIGRCNGDDGGFFAGYFVGIFGGNFVWAGTVSALTRFTALIVGIILILVPSGKTALENLLDDGFSWLSTLAYEI